MPDNLVYVPSNIVIETMQTDINHSTMIATGYNDTSTVLQPASVLSERAIKFSESLNAGEALVKSIGSNEVKRINVQLNKFNGSSVRAQAYNIRDGRVKPKQNYTGIDETIVNIFSHKGPDEPVEQGGGGIAPMF